MINIGILGYGNLAKGVEAAVAQNEDLRLSAVYTRRNPSSVQVHTKDVPVYEVSRLEQGTEPLDVLMLCGGSATDLPEQTPRFAALYHVVDSYDTHAHIPEHFARVNDAAKSAGKCALISCGWDPGMFSLQRLYASAILPEGSDYTFWGRGVSQGHSDAIRRIKGVEDARQYTVPKEEALSAVRAGKNPLLTTRDKHTRECYVVAAEGFDTADEKARIEKEIVTMPDYFADYDTTVTFVSMEELEKNHKGLPHGGRVFRTGSTGFEKEHGHVIEYSLRLESNPEFTGSVLAAYARAVHRLATDGKNGAFTVFDIAPAYLSAMSPEDMRAHIL